MPGCVRAFPFVRNKGLLYLKHYCFRTKGVSMGRRGIAFMMIMALTGALYGEEAPLAFQSRPFSDYLGEIYRVSSTLEEQGQDYRMQNLFDGYAGSSWVEGEKGDGVGETLTMAIPHGADTMALLNGFARSRSLFFKNNRVREFTLTVERGYTPSGYVTEQGPLLLTIPVSEPISLKVNDTRELQVLSLSLPWEEIDGKREVVDQAFEAFSLIEGYPKNYTTLYLLELKISAVFPGSEWDDTCLSEIRIFNKEKFSVTSVEARNGMIYYQQEGAQEKILYRDPSLILDLLDVSPDRKWCIAYGQYIDPERMRQTAYLVFHLPNPAPWNEQKEGPGEEERIPVEFSEQEGTLFLEWADGTRSELE